MPVTGSSDLEDDVGGGWVYLIVGQSNQHAEPVQRRAATAIEAEANFFEVCRTCGGRKDVVIEDRQGKAVSLEKLIVAANRERGAF